MLYWPCETSKYRVKVLRKLACTGIGLAVASGFGAGVGGSAAQSDFVHIAQKPPSNKLDGGYVQTAKDLLGNGLADPRGGTFSIVTVDIGDAAWRRKSPFRTCGWVLPSGKHVVLLDGVEYDVDKVEGPTDLALALLPPSKVNFEDVRFGMQSSYALPALLMLVGRNDLAVPYSGQMKDVGAPPAMRLCQGLETRYQMQADEALMTAKDQEALHWADLLFKVSQVEAKDVAVKDKLGFGPKADLAYATQFLADMNRRVNHPKHEPVDFQAILKLDKPARIAALIAAMDTVSAKQWGQPGGLDLNQDPVYVELVQQGKDAVPALIDTYENDERFTRSVSFHRDFFPSREVLTVSKLAFYVLDQIWPSVEHYADANMYDPGLDRHKIAATLRNAWGSVSKLTESQRSFAILNDDNAGADMWLQAAQYIVGTPYGMPRQTPGVPDPALLSQKGEVAKVMSKRARELSGSDPVKCRSGLWVAHCLSQWDPAYALLTLTDVCKKAVHIASTKEGKGYINLYLAPGFAEDTMDRLKLNDHAAAEDYREFAELVQCDMSAGKFRRPIRLYANDKEIMAACDAMMKNWLGQISSPNVGTASNGIVGVSVPDVYENLLAAPSFRKMLAKALESKNCSRNRLAR